MQNFRRRMAAAGDDRLEMNGGGDHWNEMRVVVMVAIGS